MRRWRRSPTPIGHGTPILVRCDGAGATKAWLAHLRSLREEHGLDVSFSVGFTVTNQLKDAIAVLPEAAWTVAVDAAGEPRPVDESGLPVAQVAELTGLLPGLTEAGWPEGMRVLVRRERPHPGARSACSKPTTAGATNAWPPTPGAGSSRSWRPGTAPTPGSRTGSKRSSRPAWAASRPANFRSTGLAATRLDRR